MSMQDEGRPVAPRGYDCASSETKTTSADDKGTVVPPRMGRRDWAALGLAAGLAVAWCVRLWQDYSEVSAAMWLMGGADLTLLVMGFFAALLALRGRVRELSRGQVALLAATAACALVPALNRCEELRAFNAFVLGACCLVTFYALCGAGVRRALGVTGWLRSAGNFARAQLAHVGLPFRAVRGLPGSTLGSALVGILAAAGVSLAVVPLLASADVAFANLVSRVVPALDQLPSTIIRVARCALLILLAFSLMYSALHGEVEPAASGTVAKPAPVVALGIVLGSMDALYAAFALLQVGYLFGDASANGGYAEYARTGFFQLVAVAVINLVLLAVALHTRRSASRSLVLSVLELTLVGLTAVLVASAAWRMTLYVGEYGLTLLRAMTYAGMVAIAGLLVVVAARILREDFPAVAWGTGVVLVVWLTFALSRPAVWIAQYNVDGYLSGTIERIDVDYLVDLSPVETRPALVRLTAERP